MKFKNLLLQNHKANFNQTWFKASFREGDSSLFKGRAEPSSKGRWLWNSENTLTPEPVSQFQSNFAQSNLRWRIQETTRASFLIFGTDHQYRELYHVTQIWIFGMSTSCLMRLWIFKRKEVGRQHVFPGRLTSKLIWTVFSDEQCDQLASCFLMQEIYWIYSYRKKLIIHCIILN